MSVRGLLRPRSATIEKLPDFVEKIAKYSRKAKECMKKRRVESTKR